eukprot:g12409.t1
MRLRSLGAIMTMIFLLADINVLSRHLWDDESIVPARYRDFMTEAVSRRVMDEELPTSIEGADTVHISAASTDNLIFVQEYFFPVPAMLLIEAFRMISIKSAKSITAALGIGVLVPNTIIVYDHWEDGYEIDPRHPVQKTTEIWGDGNLTNGKPPGVYFPLDMFVGGSHLVIFESFADATVPRDPSVILLDARDRILTTFPITMTRAGWPTSLGVVNAGAFEVSPLGKFSDKLFYIPVGPAGTGVGGYQNSSVNWLSNQYTTTKAFVQFETDGTEVCRYRGDTTIANRTGACQTGSKGQSVSFDVNQNDILEATSDVHVWLFTGQTNSNYAVRIYVLPPLNEFGTEWWTPVFRDTTTSPIFRAYGLVFNPSQTAPINITVLGSGTTTYSANPGVTQVFELTSTAIATRVRCSASCVGLMQHSSNSGSDWGHAMLRGVDMTAQTVVPLGWGSTPWNCISNPNAPCTFNTTAYNPLWISVTAAATVLVDEDGDGVLEGSRALTARQVWIYSSMTGDTSGAKVYTQSTSGKIIVAWGQRQGPNTPADQQAAPDVGTIMFPLEGVYLHSATLYSGENCDPNALGATYVGASLALSASFGRTVPAGEVKIMASLGGSRSLTYKPLSTVYTITNATGSQTKFPVADNAVGTSFPLDEGGLGNLPIAPLETHTVTWEGYWNCSILVAADDFVNQPPKPLGSPPGGCPVSSGNALPNDYSPTNLAFYVDTVRGDGPPQALSQPAVGAVPTTVPALGSQGSFTIRSDGTWTFTPNSGNTLCIYQSFINYTICVEEVVDKFLCDTATITVVQPPFLAVFPDAGMTTWNAPVVGGSVSINDKGLGGTTVTMIGSVQVPGNNTPSSNVQGSNGGTFTLRADGTYTFDPATINPALFPPSGPLYTSVSYTTCAKAQPPLTCTSTVLTIAVTYVVNAVDDVRVAAVDSNITAGATVLANDGGTAPLTVTTFTGKNGETANSQISGGAFVNGTNGGVFRILPDGTFDFMPTGITCSPTLASTFTSITYTACLTGTGGPSSLCDAAALTLEVRCAPFVTAMPDTGTTQRNQVIQNGTSTLLNDFGTVDPIAGFQPLTVTVFQGSGASVTTVSGQSVTGTNGGIFKIRSDGQYDFDPTVIPEAAFPRNGLPFTTSVVYTACVAANLSICDDTTLTITVNYIFAANDFSATTWSGPSISGSVSLNDIATGDATQVVSAGSVAVPADGNPSSAVTGSNGGSFVFFRGGSYSFDPSSIDPALFPTNGGPLVTSVTYTTCLLGTQPCVTAVLSISVTYNIMAEDNSATTSITTPINPGVSVLNNDQGTSPLTVTVLQGQGGQTVNASGGFVNGTGGGRFSMMPNGTYVFDPTGLVCDAVGSPIETSVSYTACLTGPAGVSQLCDTARLVVVVRCMPFATAADDSGIVARDMVLSILQPGVLSNDVGSADPFMGLDALVVTVFVGRNGETAAAAATISGGSAVNGSNGGTFQILRTGTYVFDPTGITDGAFGSLEEPFFTSVAYTACVRTNTDTDICDQAVLRVEVLYVLAMDDFGSTTWSTGTLVGSVSANDLGSGGGKLVTTVGGVQVPSVGASSGPVLGSNGGTFVLFPDGTYTFDASTVNASLFLLGSTVETSVVYTTCLSGSSPRPTTCDTAVLRIQVRFSVVANDNVAVTGISSPILSGSSVLGNDQGSTTLIVTMFEGANGQSAPAVSSNGAFVNGTGGGMFRILPDGRFDFLPTGLVCDSVGTPFMTFVNYTACLVGPAGTSQLCDTATLTVQVKCQGFVSAMGDAGITPRDAVLNGPTVLVNDVGAVDPSVQLDTLVVTRFEGKDGENAVAGSGEFVNGTNGGLFRLQADGTYLFDPTGIPPSAFPKDGSAFLTSVQYTACIAANLSFCDNATLTVEVLYIFAADDSGGAIWNSAVVSGSVSSNDVGSGNSTVVVVVGLGGTPVPPISGFSVPVAGSNGGAFKLSADGKYTFDPSSVNPASFPLDGSPLLTAVNYTACLAGAAPNSQTCDTAVLSISVTYSIAASADHAVTAFNVPISSSVSASVLGNDSGSAPLVVTPFTGLGSNGGTFTILPDGRYDFDPTVIPMGNFPQNGSPFTTSVQYTVCLQGAVPPGPLCRNAVLIVEVTYIRAANDFSATTWSGPSISGSVSLNDIATGNATQVVSAGSVAVPADGNPSSAVTGSNGGSFVFFRDGSYSFDPSSIDPALFPTNGGPLVTSVTYTTCLLGTQPCVTAVLSISVTYNIMAEDNSATTSITTPINPGVSVLNNDQGTSPLTVTVLQGQGGQTVNASGGFVNGTGGGRFSMMPNGTYVFDPTGLVCDAVGSPIETSVSYTACLTGPAGVSQLCDTARLVVVVRCMPFATAADDSGIVARDMVLSILQPGVLSNDVGSADPFMGLDALVVTVFVGRNGETAAAAATISGGSAVNGSNGGTFQILRTGTYVFDPTGITDGAFGSLEEPFFTSVAYTACVRTNTDTDICDQAVLRVEVLYVLAMDDFGSTTWSTGTLVGSVSANDLGSGGGKLVTTVGGVQVPSVGASSGPVLGSNGGTFVLFPDGTYTFDASTVNASLFLLGSTVETSVVYTTCLSGSSPRPTTCDTAVLRIQVRFSVVANDNVAVTGISSPILSGSSVLGNDQGSTTLIVTMFQGANGQSAPAVSSNGAFVNGTGGGMFRILPDGRFDFLPTGLVCDSVGTPFMTFVNYTACLVGPAGTSQLCDTATLTVQVKCQGFVSAMGDAGITPRDAVLNGPTVLVNDVGAVDPSVQLDTLVVTRFEGKDGENAVAGSGEFVNGTNGGLFRLQADGTYLFDPTGIPPSAFPKDGSAFLTSVQYTACIAANLSFCDNATLTVEVLYIFAADDSGGAIWNSAVVSGSVSSNDVGSGNSTVVVVVGLGGTPVPPISGFSVPVAGSNGGAFKLSADGKYTFDPSSVNPASFPLDGSPLLTAVNYTACLAGAAPNSQTCDTAVLSISVTYSIAASADHAVTAFNVPISSSVSASVLGNDSGSAPLVVTPFTGLGSNGGTFTILPDGRYDFDPTVIPMGNFPQNGSPFTTSVQNAVLIVEVTYIRAANDFSATTWSGPSISGSVSLNDIATGNATQVVSAGSVAVPADGNPSSAVTGSNGGSFVFFRDGSYSFDPSSIDPALFPTNGGPLVTSVTYTTCLLGTQPCVTAVLSISVTYNIMAEDNSATTSITTPINPGVSVLNNDQGTSPLTVTVLQGQGGQTVNASGGFVNGTGGGRFSMMPNGTYVFDPTGLVCDAVGSPIETSVSYTACLTGPAGVSQLCDTARLVVVVRCMPFATAADDSGIVARDMVLSILQPGVLSNDVGSADPFMGLDALVVTVFVGRNGETAAAAATISGGSAVNGSNGGTFQILRTGTYVFDPTGITDGAFGSLEEPFFTSVAYTACVRTNTDTNICDQAVLRVEVLYVLAMDDFGSTTWSTGTLVGSVSANDLGSGGGKLVTTVGGVQVPSVGASSGPVLGSNGGTFVLFPDGTYTFDASTVNASLFLLGSTVETSVVYTTCLSGSSPRPTTCDTAVLRIQVRFSVVANDNVAVTGISSPILSGSSVLGNDQGSTTLIVTMFQGANGQSAPAVSSNGAFVNGTGGGMFRILPDGRFDFLPTGLVCDSVGTPFMTFVNYTACLVGPAGTSQLCDTATLTVQVKCQGFVSAMGDAGITPRDAMLNGPTVLVNDVGAVDPSVQLDTLVVTRFEGKDGENAVAGSGEFVNGTNGGLFRLQADGTYLFDPTGIPPSAFPKDGSAFLTSVQYTACVAANLSFCDNATLTVEVLYIFAADDSGGAIWNSAVVSGSVSSNDVGSGNSTVVVVVGLGGTPVPPISGFSAPVVGSNGGAFKLSADGKYTFDPSSVNPASFPLDGSPLLTAVNYTACLAGAAPNSQTCDTAVLSISVTYSIAASADHAVTAFNVPISSSVSASVLGNDSGSAPLVVTPFTGLGSNGGTFTILPDGRYDFDPTVIPMGNFPQNGSPFTTSVQYTVCLQGAVPPGPLCRNAVLIVEVTYIRAANDFSATTWSGPSISGSVSLNDIATGNATQVVSAGSVAVPADGNPSSAVTGSNGGSFVFFRDGSYSFDPSSIDPALFPTNGGPLVTSVTYTTCLLGPSGPMQPCVGSVLTISVTCRITICFTPPTPDLNDTNDLDDMDDMYDNNDGKDAGDMARSRHHQKDGTKDHRGKDGSKDHRGKDGTKDHPGKDGTKGHRSKGKDDRRKDGTKDHRWKDKTKDHPGTDGTKGHRRKDKDDTKATQDIQRDRKTKSALDMSSGFGGRRKDERNRSKPPSNDKDGISEIPGKRFGIIVLLVMIVVFGLLLFGATISTLIYVIHPRHGTDEESVQLLGDENVELSSYK